MNFRRNMPEPATYWAPNENDGFGGLSYKAPVAFSVQPIDNWWDWFFSADEGAGVRWQEKAELFRSSDGRELTSSAVVYVPRKLDIGGKIARGLHATEQPVESAHEVRQLGESTNLRGTQRLHKVWL